MSAAALKPKPPPNPLIPEKYIDVPSQRLYYLSLGLLCQAIKTLDFIVSFVNGGDHMATCRKWLLVDFLYVVVLSQLRIPRLQYKTPSVILQIALLWLVDGLLFGGISINLPVFWGTGLTLSAGLPGFSIRDIISPLTFGLVSSTGSGDGHLLGQHTVRMSPISTAHLNPQNQNYCLSPTVGYVLVPIVLNNTQLAGLRYSVSPLGAQGKLEVHDVTAKELKVVEQAYRDRMKLQAQPAARNTEEYDEYDYDDDDDEEGGGGGGTRDAHANLGRTQSLAHLMLTKPGIVRLERASDATGAIARLVMSDTVVVPCPTVSFAPDEGAALEPVRCAHGRTDPQLKIKVSGVPPLSLRWMRTINGQREQFVVEGIEGEQQQQQAGNAKAGSGKEGAGAGAVVETRDDGLPGRPRVPSSQTVTIPLSIALEEPGTYLYALEEITDGVGNTLRVGIDASATTPPSADNGNSNSGSSFFSSSSSASSSNYKTLEDLTKTSTTRSFVVLQKPAVSFGFCSLDTPASLLIGKSTNLMLRASNVDAFDAPLEVEVAYEPAANASDSPDASSSKKGSSSGKGASKSRIIKLTAQDTRYEVPVAQPGDYRITGVKGKYCTGTVLAPDACRVVEKPRPRAEVDWKRIHECSGDTGVSASLVLHGTPPFQVYYRMQHKPSATQHGGGDTRELSKTFTSARGELVLQPPRSGKYTFTIFAVSDANYKKVEIKNSSIDQEIHPLAAAEFTGGSGDSSGSGGRGAGKKIMRSMCTGDSVEVGVALSGTAPWTVGLQIIGPNHAEVMQIQGIEDARTTLQVPIPKELRTNSGAFEIDLVSVEDQSKCKQPVSVPGIQVKVKRTVPTAQFYGRPEERHVTVTENDKASLPLRLTGDKPWHVTYRNQRTGATRTAAFHDQNANIQVADRGTYEIMSVKDSHCPGKVVTEASTFGVDWVPRPFVKLSSSVDAVYDSYKSLYTLKPICEGVNDHVDLDLTGRPPFQIMYNIGQDSDNGGTKIISQPTFNSIQPRTRFQLQTTTPGRMYYEVKQVGDAAYPLSKTRETVIPLSERLLFQQQVFVRPSARFRNRNRLTYCLHDPLVVTPDSAGFSDGLITLEGTPPFTVDVSIKNIGASVTEIRTLHIPSNTWKVDIPSYSFSSIGPHLLSIEKVVDSSSCEQAALDPLYRSIWLDVAETAAIIPFERREDICVGDVTQFQLEGIPPWTIGYKVNGRSHTQEAKTSPFSIQQQYPGTFVVSSIAHQQKMCKAAVTDLKFNIHALPSAKVGHGERIFQDIHEGDQAEIVFTLIGEPPFTFTYQRSELSTKKGVLGKVLETHTVSRVQTHEYSIFSALEGTWTVTSISDKYCRYPPAQPDPLAVEKHK